MKHLKANMRARWLAIPGAAVLAGLSVTAHAEPGSYAMVVHENSQYARQVMSHDYDRTRAALARLEDVGIKSFDTFNNLCVGYTVTKAFDKAMVACDAAIAAHDTANTDRQSYLDISRGGAADRREAIALTNRGVLKAVSGDLPGAREDFAAASDLSSMVRAASTNLKRLSAIIGESSSIAQIER